MDVISGWFFDKLRTISPRSSILAGGREQEKGTIDLSISTLFASKWLPRSSTQRIKSVSEIIPCYYIYNHKKQALSKGQKPAIFPANKAITQKDWKGNSGL